MLGWFGAKSSGFRVWGHRVIKGLLGPWYTIMTLGILYLRNCSNIVSTARKYPRSKAPRVVQDF